MYLKANFYHFNYMLSMGCTLLCQLQLNGLGIGYHGNLSHLTFPGYILAHDL